MSDGQLSDQQQLPQQSPSSDAVLIDTTVPAGFTAIPVQSKPEEQEPAKEKILPSTHRRKRTAPVKRTNTAVKHAEPIVVAEQQQQQPISVPDNEEISDAVIGLDKNDLDALQQVANVRVEEYEQPRLIKTKGIEKPHDRTKYVGFVYPKRAELYNTGRAYVSREATQQQRNLSATADIIQTFSKWDKRFKKL